MKVSLVIPMYNEEKILPDTMEELSREMERMFGGDYEILYVSDGCTDASEALVTSHGQADPRTRLLSYHPNRGKGCAVRTGVCAAQGELVIFTDCDLAYGCDVIGEFAAYLENHPDCGVVIGSRSRHPEGYAGYTRTRRWMSRLYLRLLSLFAGLRQSDSQSGIKGFRRAAGQEIFGRCETDRFAFDLECLMIARRLGFKIDEIPVKIERHRPSTIHFFRDTMRMLRDIFRIRRRVGKIPRVESK